MGIKIPLGTVGMTSGKAMTQLPRDMEEMMYAIQNQMERLTSILYDGPHRRVEEQRAPAGDLNKDGIPIGVAFVGASTRGGRVVLHVAPDGYFMGQEKFDSLSQAAEATSGVRRSGWTFWRLADGRTVKEAFGRG